MKWTCERPGSVRSLLWALLSLGLLLVCVTWLGWQAIPVYADTINVDDDTGFDDPGCGSASSPCRTISYAVGNVAASGDIVSVWPGTYTEPFTMEQGVTISGAGADVTFIDGEDVRGPMVSASGNTIQPSVVLRGFTIQHGHAVDGAGIHVSFGASPTIEECVVRDNHADVRGGGIYIEGSVPLVSNTLIVSNSALYGGGIHSDTLLDINGLRLEANSAGAMGGGLYAMDDIKLTSSQVMSNTAEGSGGGLYVYGDVVLNDMQLYGNTAVQFGGGLFAWNNVALTQTRMIGNISSSGGGVWQHGTTGELQIASSEFERNVAHDFWGGGAYAKGNAVVRDTLFISNTARFGGGLSVEESATVDRCQFARNKAVERGGGFYAVTRVLATNSLFYDNIAPEGAEIHLRGESGTQVLRHLTVASSAFTDSAAMRIFSGTVSITNTIVANHARGISQAGGSLREDYNLYYGNGTHIVTTGGTLYPGAHSLYDLDPSFVNPGKGDYHLRGGSPAIDAGIDVGVIEDIDGDPRIVGLAPDIGADEATGLTIFKSGPSEVMVGDPIVYTLALRNIGPLAATSVVITDTLPTGANFVEASDGGVLVGNLVSWTVPNLDPGSSLTRAFTITASDTVTNAYYGASCAEGVSARGEVSVVTIVKQMHRIYLPIVSRH